MDSSGTQQQSRRLRLLTYNMQVGIQTRHPADYVTRSWRHVLPARTRTRHLEPMASVLRDHDLVAIQESDAGSWRTRSLNLMDYLANRAEYPYWHSHNHRQVGPFARHAMGLLSRMEFQATQAHALPGRILDRAAVVYRMQSGLVVVVTHLALSAPDRMRQLSQIARLIENDEHVILMGDMNCDYEELAAHPALRARGFKGPEEVLHSYPSWQPRRQLDHVLVTPEFAIVDAQATPFGWSDHLPVRVEVDLPSGLLLPT